MRIRLSLTLNISRERNQQPIGDDEPPHVFESSGSLVERAEPHPIGFTREPQFAPEEI